MSAQAPRISASRRRMATVRRWLTDHDDRWSFTIVYITLAVVLSLAISLFWLVAVVALHGLIEYWSLGRHGIRVKRLGHVLWHIKLDIGLVLFALWLGVYMEVLFGMAGLSAAARTGAQAGARFLAWQRAIRGVLLTVDDAAIAAKSVVGRGSRNGASQAVSSGPEPESAPWRRSWSVGDWISIGLIVIFSSLLVTAPWLTEHDLVSMLQVMGQDLHPWP